MWEMKYVYWNWLMTLICGKWHKYVGKWLNYFTNGLKMWKMT